MPHIDESVALCVINYLTAGFNIHIHAWLEGRGSTCKFGIRYIGVAWEVFITISTFFGIMVEMRWMLTMGFMIRIVVRFVVRIMEFWGTLHGSLWRVLKVRSKQLRSLPHG